MTIKSIRICFVKFFFLISVKNKLFIHTTKMKWVCCVVVVVVILFL